MNLIDFDIEYKDYVSLADVNLQFRGVFNIPIIQKRFGYKVDHLNQVVSFDFNSHQEVKDLFEHHSSKLGAEIEGYCKDQLGYLYHDRNLKGDFKSIYEGVINDFLLILERNDSDFTTALFKLLSGEQSNILMGLEHTQFSSEIFEGFFLRNWLLSKCCFAGFELYGDLFDVKGVLNIKYLQDSMFNTNPWSHLNDKINPFEHLSPIRLFILLIQHWFLKVFSYPRLTSISKISYGRFKGSVMANILDTAPSYVLWLIFNVKHFTLAKPSLNDLTKFVVEQYKIDNNDIEFIDSILRSSSYNSDPFFYEREKIILRNCCLRYSYDNQSSIDKAQELLDVRLKVSKVMLDSLFVIHRHLEYQENLRSEKIEYPVQDCNWDKYNDQLDMDQQDPEFY